MPGMEQWFSKFTDQMHQIVYINKFSIFYCLFIPTGDDAYNANGNNSLILTGALDNSATNTSLSSSNVPSSQSVQQLSMQQQSSQIAQQIGNNGSNSGSGLVTHSQSAYEIGQVPLTPLAQHQQAIHQQLQQRFANANINSGECFSMS